MFQHEDTYDANASEGDTEPLVTREFLAYLGRPVPPTSTAGNQSDNPSPDSFLQNAPLQDLDIGLAATYNPNIMTYQPIEAPPLPGSTFGYELQPPYPPTSQGLDYGAAQSFVHSHRFFDATSGVPTFHEPLAAEYSPSSFPQLLPLDPGPSWANIGPYGRTPDGTLLPEVSTTASLPNLDAGTYSHPAPVTVPPSNQIPTAGPSRLLPSSPERKRSLPLSADDEAFTARRVVPRLSPMQSVHFATASDPNHSRPTSEILGRGPEIPQERYTTSSIVSYKMSNSNSFAPITFFLDNPEQVGIPITDILDKTDAFARIRDGAEQFHLGTQTFTLRIQWPGYKSWSRTVAALDWTKKRAPITRVKLAEAIAKNVRKVLDQYRNKPCDSDFAQWNVGPNGIQLHQICLVELHHVSKGSWQPKLCLLEPRH